jgi:tetratricopeptide (TPR) repeat protein
MAWENSIDRLILQQIHLAEKGEIKSQQPQALVRDLCALDGDRPESSFHTGYAKVLLGIDLPAPAPGGSAHRWYTFGMLRGHDRRGERNWVAELIQDPARLMDILSEPSIAAPCLPVVMRSLFGCGDLGLAVNAIEYLATTSDGPDSDLLVDASLNDLLSRLEVMVRDNDDTASGEIISRCIQLPAFEDLPNDIRARYHRALGQLHLNNGEFDDAVEEFKTAFAMAENQLRLRSSLAALIGLAELRLHDVTEFTVSPQRVGRETGSEWFGKAMVEPEHTVPEGWYGVGLLAYETDDLETAIDAFDRALQSSRRVTGRDEILMHRCRFYLGSVLLTQGEAKEANRGLRLIEQALDHISADLETFYPVHEELKKLDRQVALKFLDAVKIERGTAPDQLLIIALEYQSLGEADPATTAANRVLEVAIDIDQRVEAMRVLLTCANMRGDNQGARHMFDEIRDLLLQRGAFHELESLLQNEEFVGQALDHLGIKCELVALYEEMDDRDVEKATLQTAIARALRARKDVESLQEAFGILKEVEVSFEDLVADDLSELQKLLALNDAKPVNLDAGARQVQELQAVLGHTPRILVVGGNEQQRKHHPRFHELAQNWGFQGEWLMANYTSPQKLVHTIGDKLKSGVDVLILLHWNRHETTEPALELARKSGVPARTVHYAGFTSLQVSLTEMLNRLSHARAETATAGASGKGKKR